MIFLEQRTSGDSVCQNYPTKKGHHVITLNINTKWKFDLSQYSLSIHKRQSFSRKEGRLGWPVHERQLRVQL